MSRQENTPFKFVELREAKKLFRALAKKYRKGFVALRDEKLFESAILSVKNAYHKNLSEFAAGYVRALTQNHPLTDGNKRFSLLIACCFLEQNGYALKNSFTGKELGIYIKKYVAHEYTHEELISKLAENL